MGGHRGLHTVTGEDVNALAGVAYLSASHCTDKIRELQERYPETFQPGGSWEGAPGLRNPMPVGCLSLPVFGDGGLRQSKKGGYSSSFPVVTRRSSRNWTVLCG